MNLSDILILLALGCLVAWAISRIRKGKAGCGTCHGCAEENCPHRK